jgi:hypothetical protein
MRASRGMGAIMPSKMPGGKKARRKDGDEFTMYAEGGTVDPEYGFVGNAGVPQLDDAQLNKRFQEARRSGTNPSRTQSLQNELEQRQGRRQKIKAGVYAEGGKVNAAGNYTKPGMRKSLFESIKSQDTQGTAAGQWSARKAQLLAKKYKASGGGYK